MGPRIARLLKLGEAWGWAVRVCSFQAAERERGTRGPAVYLYLSLPAESASTCSGRCVPMSLNVSEVRACLTADPTLASFSVTESQRSTVEVGYETEKRGLVQLAGQPNSHKSLALVKGSEFWHWGLAALGRVGHWESIECFTPSCHQTMGSIVAYTFRQPHPSDTRLSRWTLE